MTARVTISDPLDQGLPDILIATAAELRKALPEPGGELGRLVRLARQSWGEWGAALLRAVLARIEERPTPLPLELLLPLRDLFRIHETAILFRFGGSSGLSRADLVRLQASGLLRASPEPVPVVNDNEAERAFRQGRQVDPDHPFGPPIPQTSLNGPPAILSPPEERTLVRIEARYQTFMRASAARTFAGIEDRVLARMPDADREKILRDVIEGSSADADRVIRTESARAFSLGAASSLAAAAARAGIPDPEVWKPTSPHACEDCRRIWGTTDHPRPWRLSVLQDNEESGGNVGLKRAEWRPTTGPTHPNCTEPGPVLYHPRIVEVARALADRLRAE